jgi:Family of unknown function (DUF6165)
MKLEVSVGEAIDKLSILHLKKKKIQNKQKLVEIEKEIRELSQCNDLIKTHSDYYRQLMYVNEEIWDMTDVIKSMTINEDPKSFASISNKIFNFNQKRFRLKNLFNNLVDSSLKEQKSYAATCCKIYIENLNILFDKFTEINYLCIEYDKVCFDSPCEQTIEILENIYRHFISYDLEIIKTINISNFNISDKLVSVFEFTSITYVAGGLFGDFIHQLSVINENFYNTGKKGILFLSNQGDAFRFGLGNTFADTYETICAQPYIHKYAIYNGESVDINLSSWRSSPYLYKGNWNYVFKSTYNVNWGKHKWINTRIDNKWSNKVVLNTSDRRFVSSEIDFNKLYKQYGNNIVFLSMKPDFSDYSHFYSQTGVFLDVYYVKTFTEMCTIINSCKLFVGTLSGPLSIAHATQTRRIICDYLTKDEYKQPDADSHHIVGLDQLWSNAFLSIEEEIADNVLSETT